MSLDNGTYILSLQNEYIVNRFHAAENLIDGTLPMEERVARVQGAFRPGVAFPTMERALLCAEYFEEHDPSEHGISIIDTYKACTWDDLSTLANVEIDFLDGGE